LQIKGFLEAVNAVIRARDGMKDTNRPIGFFIFIGPTGKVVVA